jgi:hypothetical protein
MTRFRYGTIAGIAGAAFALYNWWRRRPDYVARQMSVAGHTDLGAHTRRGTTDHPSRGAVV